MSRPFDLPRPDQSDGLGVSALWAGRDYRNPTDSQRSQMNNPRPGVRRGEGVCSFFLRQSVQRDLADLDNLLPLGQFGVQEGGEFLGA